MTNTHDFTRQVYISDATHAGIVSNDPRRAEQMRLASTLDLDAIEIDFTGGPSGGHGFRSGIWTATYAGQTYRFHASVPCTKPNWPPSTAGLRWTPPAISRAS